MSAVTVSPGDKYVTELAFTSPNMVDWLTPGSNIPIVGTFTSPTRGKSIRCQYNGTWVTSGITFNKSTGAISYADFVAVLGQEALLVEVTWNNRVVVTEQVNFRVVAA